ncbi:zinc finger, CCHC-type containing protein [Tanacetum coccineum]
MDVKTAFLNGDLDKEVYMMQPEGFVMPGNEHKFSMKDMGEADVILGIKKKCENKGIVITQSHYIEKILKKFNREDCSAVSTPMDPVEKLKPNTGKPVDQLEYSRAIGCLMYDMTSTRPDIDNAVEGYSDASWINHVEDSSSTSGWVFLLGGGTISWASKKQTCITGSTMESEFVALAAAGKEAEWLRNLIHEIPIWLKPITPISIRCDSAPTMAKAYSQIYNGKSRHLGVRHSMIRELIMNGVISIEFVRSQHNLADHLTKGLARDLVNKGQGRMRPLAGSRGSAPCWGPAARIIKNPTNLLQTYKVFIVIMAGNTVKEMTTNYGKLYKFEGHDFWRWQKKMHFLLTTLKVVYVLTTPMPELLEDATVEAIRIRVKWENDYYICRGHILNGMSDSLFDVYKNVESAKELWDSLESKYMSCGELHSEFHMSQIMQKDSFIRNSHSLANGGISDRVQDIDQRQVKKFTGSSVNMAEEGKNKTTNTTKERNVLMQLHGGLISGATNHVVKIVAG